MLFRLDQEGFAKVYRRFRKPIYVFVSRKVHDTDVAEELTQEVFLKAYRARESFEPAFGFTTWLWTIAKNTVCDWHRKDRGGALSWAGEGSCEELPCPAPSAEVQLSMQFERNELRRRMGSLTELQKKVLSLRIIHRLSYDEIARQLGLSLSAAKCLFYRAKLALADGLEQVPILS